MMKIKIVLLIMVCIALCGCSPQNEPDGQYMVTAVGADKNKNIYLQAAYFGKNEGEANPDTFTVVGAGNTFEEALSDAGTKVSKKLSVKHCELIILETEMLGSEIKEFLNLCQKIEISLQARLAVTENIQKLLKNEGISSGTELISLVKQNALSSGFGGHTALYEIKTAIMTADGDFALPLLSNGNILEVEGLLVYKGTNPVKQLSFAESIEYSKQRKLYKGEK